MDGAPAIRFEGSVFAVSPGQACVFYADSSGASRVLGGAWIAAAEEKEGLSARANVLAQLAVA